MGSASGPAASGTSLASLGFTAAASIMSAEGTASADKYKAETLDRAAQYGELKATQTNADLTRNLTMTLGNIDAVRAAAHGDSSDPTNAAVRGEVEQVATEQKDIRVDSLMAQSQEDEANAAYMRSAGHAALLAGDVSAIGGLLKGVSGMIPGLPGGG